MHWYEEDVKCLEEEIKSISYSPKLIFYGSSSIRLWKTLHGDFKEYSPINLGFGGSTLEGCVYFFERIMKPLHPKHFIIYAGDNDLGDGKTATEVFQYFQKLSELISNIYKGVSFSYVSIKPSLSRWQINDEIKKANDLIQASIVSSNQAFFVNIYSAMIGENGLPIQNYYDADGLHLSEAGYAVWKEILLTHISSIIDKRLISLS